MSLWVWVGVVSVAVIAVNTVDGLIRLRDNECADKRGVIVAVSVRTAVDVVMACAVTALLYAMVH